METVTIGLDKYHEMKSAYEELLRREKKQEFEKVRITTTLYVSNNHGPYFQKTIYSNNPDKEIQEAVIMVDNAMTRIIDDYNKELAKKHKTREDVDKLEKEIKKTWKRLFVYNIITLLLGIATGLLWANFN